MITNQKMTDFAPFAKMARLSRECVITEKLDGTNAQIDIQLIEGETVLRVGSRSRWITPEDDNFGFARWVHEHKDELITGLGFGTHFGEWWGQGIQRKYGLTEKRFSLFNTGRWNDETKPACCHVVPVLWKGIFRTDDAFDALDDLEKNGSLAAPGFMKPEGIVIYHTAANMYFKKTLEKDYEPKSLNKNG